MTSKLGMLYAQRVNASFCFAPKSTRVKQVATYCAHTPRLADQAVKRTQELLSGTGVSNTRDDQGVSAERWAMHGVN